MLCAVVWRLLYLSGDVVSAPLPPHLAPGVRSCSAIAFRLTGELLFFGRRRCCVSLPASGLSTGAINASNATRTAWRLVSEDSLTQQQRCLRPSSASPSPGRAQMQRRFSSPWEEGGGGFFGRKPSSCGANNEA
jgi:hypothetical protein